MRQLVFSFFGLFLICCNTSSQKDLSVLKFENTLAQDSTNICGQQFEVEAIIPLETTEKSLFAEVRKIVKSEEYLFILDTEGKLSVFDMQGKFIRTIGQQGQGPGEYAVLTDFAVDCNSKELYINGLHKILLYDFKGNFKKEIALNDANLQVFTFCKDKLFYIFPDKSYPDNIKTASLVTVLNAEGGVEKVFSAHSLRRVGTIPFFNNIATDGVSVFYKEELGQTIYAIDETLKLDSICELDFGKYAFQPEDFDFSRQKIWEQRYRLQNILPAKDFMIFILQKGLIGQEFAPFLWDKRGNTVCRFDYRITHNEQTYSVLPFSISENKIIGVLNEMPNVENDNNPRLIILNFTK